MVSKTSIEKKLRKKTNPVLVKLIIVLKKQKKPFWLKVASLLALPKKKAIEVNLTKLNKLTKTNEIVIVPGKLLSQGQLNHAITVATFTASAAAKEKLKAGKSKLITIEELLNKNPQAKGVKIII